MKKIINSFFAFILIFSLSFYNNIYAYTVSTHLNTSNNSIQDIKYFIKDDIIFETSLVKINNEKITTIRKVYPNNTFDMEIESSTGKKVNITGNSNYNIFKSFLEEYNNKVTLRAGKDIIGKQFKHRKLGSNSFTLYRSSLEGLGDLTGIISLLVSRVDLPISVISGIASIISHRIARNTPEKMIINITSYEILLTYDNSYYTHCYHSIVKSYEKGKLINTSKEYSQAIGG